MLIHADYNKTANNKALQGNKSDVGTKSDIISPNKHYNVLSNSKMAEIKENKVLIVTIPSEAYCKTGNGDTILGTFSSDYPDECSEQFQHYISKHIYTDIIEYVNNEMKKMLRKALVTFYNLLFPNSKI